MRKDFWVKNGVLGEIGMQRDFWVKIGVWGNGCAKALLGKIGVLGEMSMQRNIQVKDEVWGKMGMQKDFRVKNRVLLEKTNSSCRNNPSSKAQKVKLNFEYKLL